MKKVIILSAISTCLLNITGVSAMDYQIMAPNGVRACTTEYRECTASCPPQGSANFSPCIEQCYSKYNECVSEGGHPNA